MAPSKAKFADNEKVYCFHGPLLYEAKCVKSRKDPKNKEEFQFFVHYQGWNKNWDEWVPEPRVLKVNPENLEKKNKLMAEHVATVKSNKKEKKLGKDGAMPGKDGRDRPSSEKGGPGPSTPTPTSSASSSVPGTPSGTGPPGRKSESASTSRASTPGSERSLKRQDDEQSNSSRDEDSTGGTTTPDIKLSYSLTGNPNRKLSALAAKQFKEKMASSGAPPTEKGRYRLPLPEELKYVLVSDWDLVTKKKSVFTLPAKISAATIISDYVKSAEREGKHNKSRMTEIMLGVKDVFDLHLDASLLYKIESPQFKQVMVKAGAKQAPSDVYGSAHLLRLMVKLPDVLNGSNLAGDEINVGMIEEILKDFMAFLEANRTKYFTSKNYAEAPGEYLKPEDE